MTDPLPIPQTNLEHLAGQAGGGAPAYWQLAKDSQDDKPPSSRSTPSGPR